ncbi:hypothetical protein [Streptomyces sp. PSKA30]|uniref:hypothetical protein n=1 Tax=Streptomyces sp. PSKA30 TaxID=2874597 RepID=UPI001CD11919|nr:hypothetical protein [Streptomyces sp. PSKA30]MBZ9641550.1 hypothetical protein [Streptomyces sp. PSKA30]
MNITELLKGLQARQDGANARAGELRGRIEHLTAALPETEARLADLATTRKVIAELAPTGGEPDPPETTTAYQAILNSFNQHADQAFRVRELHELLGMPTDAPALNVTRSRLGRLTRQGFPVPPGYGVYQKRT